MNANNVRFANTVRLRRKFLIFMSIIDRKIKHREDVRTAIIQAARDLVLTEGWQSLSIRKIAEAIQYSSPVIYDHFINKEALLLEFVQQGFGFLNKELKVAVGVSDEPRQQLRAIAYAYCTFAADHKPYYELMFGLGVPSCSTVKLIPDVKEFTQIVLGVIKKLTAQGTDENPDAMMVMKNFWSGLHGLISLEMINIMAEPTKNKEVLEYFLKSFLGRIEQAP